jgi:hypothetical protein
MMPAPLSATRPTQPCGMGMTFPLDVTTKSGADTLPLEIYIHQAKRALLLLEPCSV